MKKSISTLLGATILASVSASAVMAQTVFTGADQAEERNEALRESIEESAERDLETFGNLGRTQGFEGSLALQATAQSGNSDSYDLGIGTDLSYVQGPNGYQLLLNYSYGEEDGTVTEESLVYGLEYTRDFSTNLFGFAKLQGSIDEDSGFDTDTFASFGAGYRILSDRTSRWSVQAGPGYRFAELTDLPDGDIEEAAFGISSDYSRRLTDTVFLTNDTDVIASESDTVVYNDLAVSVSVTDALALRTSLLTEYHTEPQAGFDDTDNTFGLSMVYSLN